MGKLRCQLVLEGPGLDLRVVRFEFRERLSELFVGDVLFEAPDADLDLSALLWTIGTVRFYDDDAVARCFSGVIEQAGYAGEHRHGVYHYRVRLLPQIHALSYRVRSRIFQNKKVDKIVTEVCTGAGLPEGHFVWRTEHPTYPEYEFRTQYKESELAFVCRLLAEEGIFFWFEHDEAGHTMHIADGPGVHVPIEPDVLHTDVSRASARQLVTELHFRTRLVRDAYLMRDWDFMSPAKPLESASGREGALGLVHYAYPGGFVDPVDGGRHAEDRLTAESIDKYVLTGSTNHMGLAPGRTFNVDGARPGFLNRGFLLIECTHSYEEGGNAAAGAGGTADAGKRGVAFRTRFVAIHDDMEFRPLALPKPKVFGIESAVITSAGEEIHVDEWGRVKLHMHWDREGKLDDNASCWVRVQQQNLSGSMLLPRIGWEVAVGFIDADPDRPLVLQKLYNRETLPPYELPANLSQTALQSASSPGGGGTNELKLQDSDGGQGFALHAQRDYTLGVGNNSTETITIDSEEIFGATLETNVGIDEEVKIGGDQKVTVKGAATLMTGIDKKITITALEDIGVKAIYTTTVDKNRTENIATAQSVRAVSMAETFSGDHEQTIGALLALTAIDTVSESVAGNKMLNIGGAYLIKTTGSFSEKNGAAKLLVAGASNYDSKGAFNLSAKAALMIKAGTAIVEKVTGNYAVSGKKVTVEAPGGATIDGGGTKLVFKGGKIKLDASKFGIKAGPMLTLKGKIIFR